MKANATLAIYKGTVDQDIRFLTQITSVDVFLDTSDGLSIFKDRTRKDLHFDAPAFGSVTQDDRELLRFDWAIFEAIWESGSKPQEVEQ